MNPETKAFHAVTVNDLAAVRDALAPMGWYELEDVEKACKDLMFWVEQARGILEKKEEREKVISGARELLQD